ncbi:hypothetical protein [Rhodococcus sovatensis]|uniref:Lipoprotein n=1 Tax=Rhodococcus sovatensis TaxID=1805840 RepID=A0ABZ2PHT6_9NOCA
MGNRAVALLLLFAFTMVGCSTDSGGSDDQSLPTPSEAPPVFSPEAQIYSAVIHRLVLTDHTFGGAGYPSPFKAVYILDALSSGGSDFFIDADGAPLEEALKSEIVELSDGLPPVEFTDRIDTRADPSGQGVTGMQDDGVVIGLSAIEEPPEGTVLVGAGFWCGVDCGFGTTYVVEESNDGWHVTRNIGPISIS